jgi:uncharacterized protein (DUF2249 family)/hemerythrin-like domain-containing protein
MGEEITTTSVTGMITAHHRELGQHLVAEVAALEEGASDGAGLVAFLQGELLPHAAGEEQHLYPTVNDLIKAHDTPTATMSLDHEYIRQTAERIATLAQQLRAATDEAERQTLQRQLLRAAVQIEAVVSLHTEKEERAYLPLIARHLSGAEQQRMLDELHETAEAREHAATTTGAPEAPTETPNLDVRALPPAQRHALIFRTFDALTPGAAFVLVNDHDPKPLYYQLNFEYRGQLVWDYLEEGPEDWRVRIGKGASKDGDTKPAKPAKTLNVLGSAE